MLAAYPAPGLMDRRATMEDDVLSYLHDAVRDQTAADPAMTAVPTAPGGKALLEEILASLDDDKAEEVVTIDLKGKSEMADYMVICSGRSSRQVAAISEKLADRLKQNMGLITKVEGKDTGDWVLIDAGDVIVHVFRPEVREFYQLEKMWMPAGARTGQTARA
jgi:ribosome-associated protein